ncbi:WecB/TagA/CpsF family glycosyltransferase [Alienimonas chondri]|uniref:UDP-N-acetyl-D-mannosaminuronic acid transferase n=1 Tax=Alienimonas chondri TaxID=2681879 RepID=A0ABX1VJZ1_9PLAN|nr:WecB/TagA/CpsF family glycosyltransferase [Alienimonas chondri]NNJ27770.1 UDP-N-acetyl-D-mannosaminuronic acid transferase [Alienimonas chondri]
MTAVLAPAVAPAGADRPDAPADGPPPGGPPPDWPPKLPVFGIEISPTTYAEAADCVVRAGAAGRPAVVSAFAVHALITAAETPALRAAANRFEMITPDGQPVRWALNLLHGAALRERVYGPTLMLEICRLAAERGVSIYLYGGTEAVSERLAERLAERFPALKIAGRESPPFLALGDARTEAEDAAAVERIRVSEAGIVFVGLGCPKQDFFADRVRDRIDAPLVCVGAAFDFHAGVKGTAPRWMQDRGLEWLYRLSSEPRRLWRRYLATNTNYLARLAASAANFPRVLRQRREWRARR